MVILHRKESAPGRSSSRPYSRRPTLSYHPKKNCHVRHNIPHVPSTERRASHHLLLVAYSNNYRGYHTGEGHHIIIRNYSSLPLQVLLLLRFLGTCVGDLSVPLSSPEQQVNASSNTKKQEEAPFLFLQLAGASYYCSCHNYTCSVGDPSLLNTQARAIHPSPFTRFAEHLMVLRSSRFAQPVSAWRSKAYVLLPDIVGTRGSMA